MQSAVVINAGLGDLSLAILKAGYSIITAYEAGQKAIDIHKQNIDVPIRSFKRNRKADFVFIRQSFAGYD